MLVSFFINGIIIMGDKMKIANNISEHIFRGYDIRGIYDTELNEDVAYTIGLGFGTKTKNEGKNITVIGYDNRESSPILFNALVKGITETGVNVINLGLVTTPMYYYALYLFKATSGIMITGSHNPKEYNGLKMTFNGIYNAYGEFIQEFKEFVNKKKFETGNGKIINEDISERYIDYITSSINLGPRKPKIVVDCGNGTPSIIIERILNKLDVDYIPLYCESDPNFPNHHPDPSVELYMADLKQKVTEEAVDVGFAYDGDGDRVGLIDENGKMINIDHFMIIIIRDIINKVEDKRFLYDVKCSKSLEDEILKLEGTPICYRTGNSYMRAKMYKDNLPFGGELSGHVFFNDKFNGYDDGIYASLRMIEILSHTNKTISELLEGINIYYSTNEIKMHMPDNIKFEKIEQVKKYCRDKGYEILDIDGCKVLFDDGFALIRASNTGPNITSRYEAKTKERLKEIQDEFEGILESLN
jgi:phosphomannomutase / phosphoglucomutase